MLYFSPKILCSFCLAFAGLSSVSARTISSADSLEVARIYQTTLDIIYDQREIRIDSLLHHSTIGLRLAKQHKLLTFVPDFNTNIAYGYKRAGEFEKAAYYSSLACKEALALNYISGIARSGYTHAMISFDKGDIKPCLQQIYENLQFARANQLNNSLHQNYRLLSHITSFTNNLQITDYYAEKAFQFLEDSTTLHAFRIKTRLKNAIIEEEEENADTLYRELRSLVYNNGEEPDLDKIDFLVDIANTYRSFGNPLKAIEIFEELTRINIKESNYPENAFYAYMAAAYLGGGQLKKAEMLNQKADKNISLLFNYNAYLTILRTEAALKEKKGLISEALKTWKEIYRADDSLSHKSREISSLGVIFLKSLESLESKFENINKENTMQRLLLEKEKRQKILLLSLVVILIVFSIVIYYLFRKLSLGNQKIREQNEAISLQTESLRESNMIKDKLFSLLSHELRSPVAELITLLDVNEWKNKGHSLNPYFKNINLKAKILYNTLDNVLTWSASQLNLKKTEIKSLNISEAVSTTLNVCEPYIHLKNIRVENEVTDALIYANESYLMIIFRNLLNNATKFTPSGGIIRLYSVEEDDYSGVVIKDSGVGIEPEKLGSLLMNVQNSSEGTDGEKGSGMGLLLCKDLIDKLQGKIEVSSRENQGTSVKLLFKKADHFQV